MTKTVITQTDKPMYYPGRGNNMQIRKKNIQIMIT